MLARFLIVAMLVAVPLVTIAAETLLYDGFQDRASDGWRGFGQGDMRITEYQGNVSLQLSADSAVARKIDLHQATRARLGASFAATGLSDDGECVAEATFNDGGNWSVVTRVVSGQDDSVTLHSEAMTFDVPHGSETLWVRARVVNGSSRTRCWLDNVFVIAETARDSQRVQATERKLSRAFLLGKETLSAPVSMREFAAPEKGFAPRHVFSGSLELNRTVGSANIIVDDWGRQETVGPSLASLPEFAFDFVQDGRDLIPLLRGVQRREHPYWEIILQPGRVWTEADDADWTRASMPFSLQERGANCTHNGVLSWLFSESSVSRVVYQISGETCGYLKLDLWGAVPATYTPKNMAVVGRAHIERLHAHRSHRLPIRDLAQLAVDYPGVEPLSLAVDDGIRPADISVLGMVVDGVHYRSDCSTRAGPYPFCDSMPLPSYSTAKSIFGAVAFMRMEQLYPGTAGQSIAAIVASCKSKKWRDVSIEHALDMATGNYQSKSPSVDEDAEASHRFIFDDRHASKTNFACDNYRRKARPGTRFVYHTSDTYLVGAALQNVLRQHQQSADVYKDLLLKPIWDELHLSPLLDDSKRTYDDEAQPLVGYGLTYEVDDILRIANWLSEEDGFIGGQAMLDTQALSAALQRDPNDRGLDAGFENLKYNNGFWAFDAGPSLDCMGSVWVPFMSGVSGITVAMFPNGVTYYYFSDSYVYRWQSARQAAHLIKGLCQ